MCCLKPFFSVPEQAQCGSYFPSCHKSHFPSGAPTPTKSKALKIWLSELLNWTLWGQTMGGGGGGGQHMGRTHPVANTCQLIPDLWLLIPLFSPFPVSTHHLRPAVHSLTDKYRPLESGSSLNCKLHPTPAQSGGCRRQRIEPRDRLCLLHSNTGCRRC